MKNSTGGRNAIQVQTPKESEKVKVAKKNMNKDIQPVIKEWSQNNSPSAGMKISDSHPKLSSLHLEDV